MLLLHMQIRRYFNKICDNSLKSVLGICTESVFALKYSYLPSNIRICHRIQFLVSAQWSQRFYDKIQGQMVHKDIHKIIFQSH
jgi:hypothetical protein